MKLLHVIALRISVLAAIVLAFWSVFFYFALMDEVNDETDDSLEDYAEMIIIRSLTGEPLPTMSSGSNNQFYLRSVSPHYAATHPHVSYADRDVYIREKRETEPARVLAYIFQRDDGSWMEVEVSTPVIDKADLRMAIFGWLVFLYAAILVCIVAVNVWAVKRSMKPLRVLLAWLDNYRIGVTGEKLVNPTKIEEFRKLNDAITRSTERNEQSFQLQKAFIGNASHEMQTPLAVCCGRIEMLLDDDAATPQQMEELVKTLHTLKRLSRMNRSLLLLCKIDNGQFTDSLPTSLGETARQLLPDYESAYAHRGIKASIYESGCFTMDMDPGLAATLVGNLMKNAFVHNLDNGKVDIRITDTDLTIANTGQSSPLDARLIFERFYHTPGKTTSTGLGLSIAKAICRLYNLSITYSFEQGLHTFTIRKQAEN